MEIVCIYTGQVAQIRDIHIRTAQREFKEIRKTHGKKRRQPVTLKEYSLYSGIPEEELLKAIKKLRGYQ